MGRGVSAGGGQSSLGYLFGRKETTNNRPQEPPKEGLHLNNEQSPQKPEATPSPSPSQPVQNKFSPLPLHDCKTNNYLRAEGQNCGNFITERRTTKVHAAPGGGSSLGYLFGGDDK